MRPTTNGKFNITPKEEDALQTVYLTLMRYNLTASTFEQCGEYFEKSISLKTADLITEAFDELLANSEVIEY